jgi:hypothetical protein
MRISQLATLSALVAATSVLGGCVTRKMIAFQDNPKQAITNMQVLKITNYLFSIGRELVFYSCTDDGKTLNCKRACGGTTDLGCPESTTSAYSTTTNIR